MILGMRPTGDTLLRWLGVGCVCLLAPAVAFIDARELEPPLVVRAWLVFAVSIVAGIVLAAVARAGDTGLAAGRIDSGRWERIQLGATALGAAAVPFVVGSLTSTGRMPIWGAVFGFFLGVGYFYRTPPDPPERRSTSPFV